MFINKLILLIVLSIEFFYPVHCNAEEFMTDKKSVPLPIIGSQKWSTDGTRETVLANAVDFLGDEKGSYVNIQPSESASKIERVKVANQFSYVFMGQPYASMTLSDGNTLLAASKIHDAQTKAMVVTSGTSNEVRAVALLHQNCGRNHGRDKQDLNVPMLHNCDTTPSLTIFYTIRNSPDKEINLQLVKWVNDELDSQNVSMKNTSILQVKKFSVQIKTVAE